MIVAGVMSGTSADGINVALVRIAERVGPKRRSQHEQLRERGRPLHTIQGHKLIAHQEFPFPAPVRRMILRMMNAGSASVADLARLNFLLGVLYADAVANTARKHRVKVELIGCHGQTIYHQGESAWFLGRKLAVTWQTGEAAMIAAQLGVPVVSDFRPADMAAGGKGAPLVPFFDFLFYRDESLSRIAQNIGGIANLTAMPAAASLDDVVAFDTGPGHMVIDAVMQELYGRRYDGGGKIAASGRVLEGVIAESLAAPFFRTRPPKTAGREEFGREYVANFLRICGRAPKQDIVATATRLTTRSIADAVQRFVIGGRGRFEEMIVSGGGAKNRTLMAMLREQLTPIGIEVRHSEEFGVPSEAKEAMAFAILAYETWNRRPSNVPSATGAKRAALLGKVSYA